ncbi:hypothetical protein CBI38_36485 (plasmid) [Rhodococcus oxybenzonivorans]|uniref:Uncharacterized protein n=1 Tax=Rhodococcus oxybenzonivorans TaxID=1990687 RepID=A0A2S2C7M1_9NOCA|nr:hypothetical protein [Rhodococcus oxybenzonivorans]AWK76880.1 hypothetical protein CBI38_36485 [Rhodococcus oxybenzonivorans]
MIPAEAGDRAARVVLDLIDRVESDTESDQFLMALDCIHLQLFSPRVAAIVTRRAELGFAAHDVNTYPRRNMWRTQVPFGRTNGGIVVEIPLVVIAPVLIGMISVLLNMNSLFQSPLTDLTVFIFVAAGVEVLAMWWWIRRDPLRLTAADERMIRGNIAKLEAYVSAGGDFFELRLAMTGSAIVDDIRDVPAWSHEDLDIHCIRLDIEDQLRAILGHCGELATFRVSGGEPTTGVSAEADAARASHHEQRRWFEQVKESLIGRVAALWTLHQDLLMLQDSTDGTAALGRIDAHAPALGELLVNSANDDLETSAIGDLANDLVDLHQAREAALAQLRGDVAGYDRRS